MVQCQAAANVENRVKVEEKEENHDVEEKRKKPKKRRKKEEEEEPDANLAYIIYSL